MRTCTIHMILPALFFAGATLWASEFSDSVIRLKKAGLSEPVLQAYVNNAKLGSDASELTLDEIEELENAGVPDTVIVAMADRTGTSAEAGAEASTSPTAGVQPQYSYQEPAAEVEPIPAHAESTVLYAPPAQEMNISYFYGSLAPYGEWHRHSHHGWVWTPHVTLRVNSWRPYCNEGRWIWTDCGWYWQSNYPWGWAAFHYGRWLSVDGRWCWVPGTEWGPAWVHWRSSDDYYGWAPLPPEARFRSGVGFFYRDEHVSVGFNFGLTADAYAFVPTHNFLSINLGSFALDRPHVHRVYNRTRIVNNTYIYNDNRVYNQGIPVSQVSEATNTGVRRYTVSEMRVAEGRAITRGEKVTGTAIQVYKPALKETAPLEPKQAIQRAELRRSEAVKRSRGRSFSNREESDSRRRLESTKRALEQRSKSKAKGATREERSGVQTEAEPIRGKAGKRIRELKENLKSRKGRQNSNEATIERKGSAGGAGAEHRPRSDNRGSSEKASKKLEELKRRKSEKETERKDGSAGRNNREVEQRPRDDSRENREKATKRMEELKKRKAEQEMEQETRRKNRIADPEVQPRGRNQTEAVPGLKGSERGEEKTNPGSDKGRGKGFADSQESEGQKAHGPKKGQHSGRGKHQKNQDEKGE